MSTLIRSHAMRFPTQLPIDAHLPALLEKVRTQPVTLIQAPPGTGKTVHLPLALLQLGKVWVLEPRRVAARLAAQFATQEFVAHAPHPETVGYHFRNEKRTSAHTQLAYLTEGMLLRLAQSDPQLNSTQVVVLDEFHERHSSTDTAWAYLRHLQRTTRPDLRIVILSATLDLATLTAQIPELEPTVVEVTHHKLEVFHRPDATLTDAVRDTAEQLTRAKTPGSILVFLSGRKAIDQAQTALLAARCPLPIEVLHGGLDAQEQARVVAPGREPRVILATNLAESSITVDGVRAVIDTGEYRQAHAQPWTGVPELRTRRITRASAIQRAGRAARQAPGTAVRLYSQGEFASLLPFETPELLRSDLSPTLLELIALGVAQPEQLPWLDPPPPGTWATARQTLTHLDFLNTEGRLTPAGKAARAIPSSPRVARLVLDTARIADSSERRHLEDLAIGLALDQLPSGDCSHLQLPDTYAIREERKRLFDRRPDREDAATKTTALAALMHACGDHTARLKSSDEKGAIYLTASGVELWMAPARGRHSESRAAPSWIVALSVLDSQHPATSPSTSGTRRLPQIHSWISFHTETEAEAALLEAPARYWSDATQYKWEADRQTFVQLSQSRFGQILLSENRRFPEPSDALGARLAEKFLALAQANPETNAWIESTWVRLKLSGLLPEKLRTHLTPWEGGMLTLIHPLAAQWSSLKDAPEPPRPNDRTADLAENIAQLTDPDAAQKLRKLAPRALHLPKRQAPILYSLREAPRCESRLQDFLGFKDTPRVGQPPQPLTLVLLAPNYRPVQITQDLASFWRNTYPALRRELMRRYPRHAWPEDPSAPLS